MEVNFLQSLFILRVLWFGCCYVVVWIILIFSIVSIFFYCLFISRRVESVRGIGLRGDRFYWIVEFFGIDVCIGVLSRGRVVSFIGVVVFSLIVVYGQSQFFLVIVYFFRVVLVVRGLGTVSLVVKCFGRIRVLVRVGCIQWIVVIGGVVGVIV